MSEHEYPCSICEVEFPSSKPNPAVLDAPLAGGGPWAYFCEAHIDNAKRGIGTRLDTGQRDRDSRSLAERRNTGPGLLDRLLA